MTLKINSLAPDFKAKTTIGDISFHEWLGIVGVFYFRIQKILLQFVQLVLSLNSFKPVI